MNSLLGLCCDIAQYCSTVNYYQLECCCIAQYRNTTPKVSSYSISIYELTFGVVLRYCAILQYCKLISIRVLQYCAISQHNPKSVCSIAQFCSTEYGNQI